MKKQTAVEWYIEQRDMLESVSIEEYWERKNSINEQAKQIEKEEIMKVVMDFGWSKEKADKYYNDTYGGNNE